ncbi:Rho GTPase-activating protein 36 [Saguinus oedipus]|uniref:Rho GTPase-activating protein 36 n=1 Tax=Saguinus oedipus TaxID=9490 RepID=A0ABQ9TH50_SAGOE|nr:Rho GTPase-activating protein 36 [Saguinus oedipus]
MVSIHSLSELERLKLQETAYRKLVARHFLSEFKPERAMPIDRPNTLEKLFVVLRRPERVVSLKTFGVRLEEVIVNELTRRKQLELTAAMQVEEANGQGSGRRRGNVVQRMFGRIRRFFSRRRNEPTLPREFTRRGRRGAVCVDSLAELEDGALLLQTLQLSKFSLPIGQRLLGSKRKMSLNPIAKQVPQVVEACCQFIEKHGLSTVGIFTLEYSAHRVHKLREAFDQGLDVVLDDNQNVHDVAALLKEFFCDMKDSLLPDDLYLSFLLTATLKPQDQLSALQLLVYLMPPCHSDTLERLLKALHKITENCEDSIGIDGQLVPGNRMTSNNLALVFGSALLKKGKFCKRRARKTKLGIDQYVASVNVVRAMIDNWDVLFQVPPNIQRQVAKRVWKSSPEALDFIRRRKLRKIQSARIKMEEDALLSDPVETSAEAQAAVLAQSKPFDEGLEIPNNLEIQGPHLEGIPELDEEDDDHDDTLNFDDLPPLGDTLEPDYEIPELIEIPDFEEIPLEEVPAVDKVPNDEASNAEEIPDYEAPEVNGISDSEEDLDFEEVPALHVKDQVNALEEEEVTTVAPETEDVSILNTIPDPPQDLAVNLEEIMNVEEVPVPKDSDSDEVQNPKAIQFHKDADVAFPVDTPLSLKTSLSIAKSWTTSPPQRC